MNRKIKIEVPQIDRDEASPKPTMAVSPSGEFLMGSREDRDEEHPVHRVWVDEFEMAIYQVRNLDYMQFVRQTGHVPPPLVSDPAFCNPDQPVVSVSWFDALAYCEWLSKVSGRRYRLPTEAEWERAARGGREGGRYPWGEDAPESLPDYASRWKTGPEPVGLYSPNPLGVYNLGENVHEWCSDWFDPDYYAVSPYRNPQGPVRGGRRASRGGAWRHHIKVSRCAARSSIPPDFQYADYGFRVVREPKGRSLSV